MSRERSEAGFWQRKNFTRSQSLGQPESYDNYRMNIREIIKYGLQGVGIAALVSYVFYRSVIVFLLLLIPGLIFLFRQKKKDLLRKRKEELNLQFKEMMHAVIAGLQAGYSIENAFIHAYQDICLLYGKQSMMAKELYHLTLELRNNRNIEDILSDFAARCQVADIRDFAEVFHIAKKSGGNLVGILKNTADVISDKIEVKREITTMISAKRLEQGIMDIVPFAIILYIDVSSPGFFDGMYHNLVGMIIMTILLAVYIAAYLIAEKIIHIDL